MRESNNYTSSVLIAFLFFVFFTGIAQIIIPFSPSMTAFIELVAYTLIAALIIHERSNLTDYHIDRIALIIFWVFGALLKSIPDQPIFSALVSWMGYMLVGSGTIFYIYRYKNFLQLPRVTKKDLQWNLLGMVIGICFAFFIALMNQYSFIHRLAQSGHPITLSSVLAILAYQLQFTVKAFSGTALLEEPIYRGFLWGYLNKKGWKQHYILFAQTLLFSINHLGTSYANSFIVWYYIPIGGVLFGILAWKSKSITPCIIAHAFFNGIVALNLLNI